MSYRHNFLVKLITENNLQKEKIERFNSGNIDI